MKRAANKRNRAIDDMRSEYDFRGGVRGKYSQSMQAGYKITIHKEDGTTVVQEIRPGKGMVVLEPDVQRYFPDSDSVNAALRNLIELIPGKRKSAIRKTQSAGTKRKVTPGKQSRSLRS